MSTATDEKQAFRLDERLASIKGEMVLSEADTVSLLTGIVSDETMQKIKAEFARGIILGTALFVAFCYCTDEDLCNIEKLLEQE